MVEGGGHPGHPPQAIPDDRGRPVGRIRGVGPGPGRSAVFTIGHGRRHLSEGDC